MKSFDKNVFRSDLEESESQAAASKMTKSNQHLTEQFQQKTEQCNRHESGIYCRPVLLDCISFSSVYLYAGNRV